MKKDELHIPDSIKNKIETHLTHQAPDELIENVINRVSIQNAPINSGVQGYFNILILSAFVSLVALLWAFVPEVQALVSNSMNSLSNSSFSYSLDIPLVFWWSLLAVAGLWYFDMFIQKGRVKKKARA